MAYRCELGRSLGVAVGLVLTAQGCVAEWPRLRQGVEPPREAARADPEEILQGLVEAHNALRTRAGLPDLTIDPRLEAAARKHASGMASRGRLTHTGSDRSSPFQRMEAEGYHYRRAAENIACGRFTLESLIKSWMASPPHRRNILGPYSQIGAAYAIAEDGTSYWCVTFGDSPGP